jgi:hypothetical protein
MRTWEQPVLISAIDDEVSVEYGHFALQADHSGEVALGLGLPARLMTAGPSPTEWDLIETGQLHTDTPGLHLTAVTGSVNTSILKLPTAGTYNIRSHARGRLAAAALGEASYRHNIEHWLIQLWPTLDLD